MNVLQQVLAQMGSDERRDSPEFQHIFEQYKRLSGELHKVRYLVAASVPVIPPAIGVGRAYTPPPVKVGATFLTETQRLVPERTGPPAGAGGPAADLPLALPKFTSTLGPAGRPGVVSSGPEVDHLQQLLAHLGYDVPQTQVYDARTSLAIRAFQQAQRLTVNGLVGADTRRLLNRMVSG